MADDRLPCCRSESIAATKSDKVMSRPLAISLSPFQNASSRLTLVLWPAMTIDRLTTGDFIGRLPYRDDAHQADVGLPPPALPVAPASFWIGRAQAGSPRPVAQPVGDRPVSGPCVG